MNTEDNSNSDFFKQQEAYKREVEKKRQELRSRLAGHSPLKKVLNCDNKQTIDPLVLDEWFIKSCDNAPEVKKYLNFYYEKIKECRYDEIATRIVDNSREYERICDKGLDCPEILREEERISPLYYKVKDFAFKPIFGENDDSRYDVRELQESISKALSEESFHVNIFIIGLTVTKLHDFARLSLISHELGVLSREGEIPSWTLDCPAKPRQKTQDKFCCENKMFNEKKQQGIYHDIDLYEKLDPFMDARDYLDYLTELSARVSGTISALYNSAADGFLTYFWKCSLGEEFDDKSLETAKNLVFNETQRKFNNITIFSPPPEKNPEYAELERRLSENFRSYREIFTVKKPPVWNVKKRLRTLSALAARISEGLQKMTQIEDPQNFARFDPYDPNALKDFSPVSTVPMNKLILVMNSSDHWDFLWLNDEEEPSNSNNLRTFLENLKKEGLTICTNKSIDECNFKIVQKGMFILNNVMSRIYVKSVSPKQEITYSYKELTIPMILDFGLGIHVLGLGVCPSKIYFEKYVRKNWTFSSEKDKKDD